MRVVAPHLVRRLTFLLPLYRDGPYRRLTIQTGLWLYSTLARERLGGVVEPERAAKSVPGLRLDSLQGCGLYSDAWTHDSRLCLANVRSAAERGAVVFNRAASRRENRSANLTASRTGDANATRTGRCSSMAGTA